MHLVEVAEAGPQLAALVQEAQGGEEVVLTQDNAPVVRLTLLEAERPKRQFGSGKDALIYIAPDFDELGEEWEEYM